MLPKVLMNNQLLIDDQVDQFILLGEVILFIAKIGL